VSGPILRGRNLLRVEGGPKRQLRGIDGLFGYTKRASEEKGGNPLTDQVAGGRGKGPSKRGRFHTSAG